jgi:murein DD-endopeptidase MepM/ murein hydrolase activator NlpD
LPTSAGPASPLGATSVGPDNLPTVAISTGCQPRSGWNSYVIQPGDTLFGIARQAGVSLTELQQANCISNPSAIFFGQVISVPPGSAIATATPGVNATASVATGSGNAGVCPNPNVRITSPISGATVSGIITFTGTAGGSDFSAFRVEYMSDLSDVGWIQTARSDSPVLNGYLGRLDPNPSQLPAGAYSVRLAVETKSGNLPQPCLIRLTLVK